MTSRDPQRCCEAVRSAVLATAWLLVLLCTAKLSGSELHAAGPRKLKLVRCRDVKNEALLSHQSNAIVLIVSGLFDDVNAAADKNCLKPHLGTF